MKYLYGASIQGIQEFIFATNRLKEIIGASELVESISTELFKEILKELKIEEESYKIVVMAAGNVRILFDNLEDVKKIFDIAPKRVMQKAYGITLSQAVEKVEENLTRDDIDRLERKLKSARNIATSPLDSSLNATYISPRTGKSASEIIKVQKKEEFVDRATAQKDKASEDGKHRLLEKIGFDPKDKATIKKFSNEISKLSNSKNKIAIIHADGNGLGMILQKIGEAMEKNPTHLTEVYSQFSKYLDESTIEATKTAFEKSFREEDDIFRFRPVVLGGDDLTIICDVDRSLTFIENFLREFEIETKKRMSSLGDEFNIDSIKDGLTACAGIAYCNEKFPFHYAIHLAEELCSYSKKYSKEIDSKNPPSSIAFHNIQSSYLDSFSSIQESELRLGSDKGEIHLDFAPYYLHSSHKLYTNLPTIKALRENISLLMQENSPASRLRNWLNIVEDSQELANFALKRVIEMSQERGFDIDDFDRRLKRLNPNLSPENLIITQYRDSKNILTTPIYNILQIYTISGATQ